MQIDKLTMCQTAPVPSKHLTLSEIIGDAKRSNPKRSASLFSRTSSCAVISDSEHQPFTTQETMSRAHSPTERPVVSHDYKDHSYERDPTDDDSSAESFDKGLNDTDDPNIKRRGPRGGVAIPFPEKLYLMLSTIEREGKDRIVSWQPHGRCFHVHNPKEFVSDVMTRFFKQTKLTSFQRQLNLYGFCRLTSGRDRGGYYHELFLKGRPFLCRKMVRTRIKGTGIKASSNPTHEPNFYGMPFVRPLDDTPVSPLTVSLIRVNSEEKIEPAASMNKKLPSSATSLAMPCFPKSTDSTFELKGLASSIVTPDVRPVASTDIPSNWLLSNDHHERVLHDDDVVLFEGKSFHYLAPTFYATLEEEPGYDQVWDQVWKSDDFLAPFDLL